MQAPRILGKRRLGFTLIELLVVIAIIAVLVSLTSAAVLRVLNMTTDVSNSTDINQLQTAMQTFRQERGMTPPSRIVLYEKLAYYGNTPVEQDSIAFLQQIFGNRIVSTDPNDATTPWTSSPTVGPGIIWSPATGTAGTNPYVLEGDQCLVFFLGGIQVSNGGTNACMGFSSNPKNPMDTNSPLKSPAYDFKPARLVVIPHSSGVGNNAPFFSYMDAYNKKDPTRNQPSVFAYFSSYKTRNGYNRYFNSANAPYSDCQSLRVKTQAVPIDGVWPYRDANNYQNPDTFQIISAGRDATFGPGSFPTIAATGVTWQTWTPATANTNVPTEGRDDMSNFYGSQLGVAQ
jgi:prepilin-type N-terminal cleavage/methylation domain-containing protein